MSTYAKAIAALFGAISAWGITAIQDGIDGAEWFGLLGVLGTVLLVWATPNAPQDNGGQITLGLLFVVIALICAAALLLEWENPNVWTGIGIASAALAAATSGVVVRR